MHMNHLLINSVLTQRWSFWLEYSLNKAFLRAPKETCGEDIEGKPTVASIVGEKKSAKNCCRASGRPENSGSGKDCSIGHTSENNILKYEVEISNSF